MRKTTGLSLFILVFLSLCLIVFSLLSLSGASADQTLSQKTADRTAEYYHAVSEANQILSSIDALLAEALLKAEQEDEPAYAYPELSQTALSSVFTDADTNPLSAELCTQESLLVSFSVPVTEDQILVVELTITYPEEPEDPLYQISGWYLQNIGEWTPDLSQNVYQP